MLVTALEKIAVGSGALLRRSRRRLAGLWEAWNRLFGFDLFVSYRWADGATYAEALAAKLSDTGLAVFLDRLQAPGGVRVRADIRRSLLKSQALVVIASPDAVASHTEITPEIDIFAATHPKRQLLGLEFTGELRALDRGHPWYSHFHKTEGEQRDDLLWHHAPGGLTDLEAGSPDRRTIDYLLRSLQITRQRVLARKIAATLGVLLLGLAAFGAGSVINALEQGKQTQAMARGFEAIDRADEAIAGPLLVAQDSLSLRDSFAGRRAAMTFWAQTPRITAVNDLFMQSPAAVRRRSDGGFDVIGSGGFVNSLTPTLEMPTRSLAFDIDSQGTVTGVSVAVADGDAAHGFAITSSRGQIFLAEPERGEIACELERLPQEATTAAWLAGPTGQAAGWLAIGQYCAAESCQARKRQRLTLRAPAQDLNVHLNIDHPEQISAAARLHGRNCLLLAGKDWEEDEQSLMVADIALEQGIPKIRRLQALGLEGGFGTTMRQLSLEPSLEGAPGRYAAIIVDAEDPACSGSGSSCSALVVMSLPGFEEIGRLTAQSLNLVHFLDRPTAEAQSWLVVGDYDGGIRLYRPEDFHGTRRQGAPPALSAFLEDPVNADSHLWRNRDQISIAFRTDPERFAVVTDRGLLLELGLPDNQPRFGTRFVPPTPRSQEEACVYLGAASRRALAAGHSARAGCADDPGDALSAVVANPAGRWVFGAGQDVRVFGPDGITQRARGRSPDTSMIGPNGPPQGQDRRRLSRIVDGVADPRRDGVWALRQDGTMLYLSVQGGAVQAKEISYGNRAPPVIAGETVVAFSSSALKLRDFASARSDFETKEGPVQTVTLFGTPLIGMAIPATDYLFVAVAIDGELAFEIVDLVRRRSLAAPVRLSQTLEDWGNHEISIGLGKEAHPAVRNAQLRYLEGREEIELISPAGIGFRIPFSLESWRASLADVLKWRPETETAAALGLAPDDYPLRPRAPVEPTWSRQCPLDPAPQSDPVADFLSNALGAKRDRTVFSGKGASAADRADRIAAQFPAALPGCPDLP